MGLGPRLLSSGYDEVKVLVFIVDQVPLYVIWKYIYICEQVNNTTFLSLSLFVVICSQGYMCSI